MVKKNIKIPQIRIDITMGSLRKTKHLGPFTFRRCAKNPNSARWELKDKDGHYAGSMNVSRHNDSTNMCVTHSNLREDIHGLGIGRMMYQHLIDYYSILESDPSGVTSEKAAKVWKSLGAKLISGSLFGDKRWAMKSKINPPKKHKRSIVSMIKESFSFTFSIPRKSKF